MNRMDLKSQSVSKSGGGFKIKVNKPNPQFFHMNSTSNDLKKHEESTSSFITVHPSTQPR